MFNRNRSDKPAVAQEIGLLGVDTRFEGSIRFQGTLRIDGTVMGNIVSDPGSGTVLIVNQAAAVHGDVVADSVLISGRVEGNVHARERVEIYRAGVLIGDVFTGDIMVEGGAEFQGYCHMDDNGGGPGRRPADGNGSAEAEPAQPALQQGQGSAPAP